MHTTPLKPDLEWVAYYEDGSVATRGETAYTKLKRKGISEFILKDKDRTIASVKPERGERVFYRRRAFVPLGDPRAPQVIWYLLGARSRKTLRLQVITPSGSVLIDNQFRQQWYEPQWFKPELSIPERVHARLHRLVEACIQPIEEAGYRYLRRLREIREILFPSEQED